ncbi:dienelactone hydrolase family protein [Flavobacteriaceae bacterium F89]|uniref:Dienelactone hydrolase family protein n=1 Tax=Cerina litoralis TaxID=2874477 RepID=A0AAE3EYA5_9FLAO|nr:dienelactone hydrolase family protein [Cerina litoralis]MCG2462730.1 dienelactone hydrolase family protein [Cerina litoralis]
MKATAVVKKSEIKKIAMDAGIHDYALKMTNGKKWDVRILIPIMGKEQKYPLVLALHWAGDQEAYRTYSECLVFPAFQNINTFIVVPTSDGSHWIDPKTETRVIDLLRKLKIRFPIAKDQIVVTGYSNGGIGSWKYAEAYPNLFSAAIPMAGYYEKKKIRIPVYTIHGEKDELFKVSIVQNAMAQSKKMGSPIDLSIVKGLSHYMACSYTDVLHEKALHLQETIFKNVEHQ